MLTTLGWSGVLCEQRIDDLFELGFGSRTHYFFNRLPVLEKENRGNAHDLKLAGNLGNFIGIEFHDLQFAFILFSQFFDDRGDHLTRSTPDGPKINHDQSIDLTNLSFPIASRCLCDEFGHGILLFET